MSYSVIYSKTTDTVEDGGAPYRISNGAVIGWLLALVTIGLTPLGATIYSDAYPAELLRRQALERCSEEDSTFIRFLATAREACYRRLLPVPPTAEVQPAIPQQAFATANFVDLWQAAGRGHLPANDVRAQTQSATVAAMLGKTTK